MSRFFIQRPIFASVLAFLIVMGGLLSINSLPIEQYPNITPPTVMVSAFYPGADAQTVSDAVAQPIEQQVNGVENMLYMNSVCSNNGSYQLTITFEVGTDINMANVLVQNRVALATPQLPNEVKQLGVTVLKKSTNIILSVALTSPDQRFNNLFLTNYANLNIFDEIKRIDGVGDVGIYGAGNYSMRIWMNPGKMQSRNLTVTDVANAIREQNVQVASGQIGAPPVTRGTEFMYTLTTKGRLSSVEEFGDIVIKKDNQGKVTYLKDIARIEMGSQDYTTSGMINGKEGCVIMIYQLPGSNALDVEKKVLARMEELSKRFPDGMDYIIPFDSTDFVKASIHEVVMTLLIAILLVIIVIFIFLQDIRATIIPAITIPVSLIGTFAVMSAMGFSINMLTLFGLILAIGIVVDDAIVVVENTSRHLEAGVTDRKKAATDAIKEVTGPIVGTTLVLLSVFIPTAFIGGVTGQLYKQFALTIAISTVISAFNALTLSPALCAIVLRPPKERKNWFFKGFNKLFSKAENAYIRLAGKILTFTLVGLLVYLVFAASGIFGLMKYPSTFLPDEDQGYFMIHVQLPNASSLNRTKEVVAKMDKIISETNGVQSWFSMIGYSMMDQTISSNNSTMFVILKNWDERKIDSLKAQSLINYVRKRFTEEIPEAFIFPFSPPAISGLGISAGFTFILQDRAGIGAEELQQITSEMVDKANQTPECMYVSTTYDANVPQIYLDIDREKAKLLQLSLNDVFTALQSYFGSLYVNDFNIYGRIFQVKIMADSAFRSRLDDIRTIQLRNMKGQMVSLGSLVKLKEFVGPSAIKRYNQYPSATINGYSSVGYSSGQSMSAMEKLAAENLPATTGYEWTGMSYQEKESGSQSSIIFILALVLIFMVLAAQYESFRDPFGVILSVPIAIMGAILALMIRGMPLSIYGQIGLILLIALASKNAILIVEFARDTYKEGKSAAESSLHAARLRFRPILMTSFAFILGVWPLVVASGAAAASRQYLGTAVFGGMLVVTMVAIFFVPMFYDILHSGINIRGKKKNIDTAGKNNEDIGKS